MPQLINTFRFVVIVSLVCLGGYALAVAQPGPSGVDGPEDAAPLAEQEVEESPLLIEPTTPDRMFDAAVLSNKLGRPKLAKRYLEQMLEREPDDDLLLRLREELGPAVFLTLANNEHLRPAATDLLERVNEAFRRRGADPDYVDGLIDDLNAGPEARHVAEVTLRNAGLTVVSRLIRQLADPRKRDRHDRIVRMLSRMGEEVVPALLGALESTVDNQRAAVISVLGSFRTRDIAAYLLHPAFAESEPPGVRAAARQSLARILNSSPENLDELVHGGVADKLQSIALVHLRDEHVWDIENGGTVALWTWVPETLTVTVKQVSPTIASLHVGSRFARQALNLSPHDRGGQALFLSLSLAREAEQAGWDQPLPTGPGTAHDLALTAGPQAVLAALQLALKHGNAAAVATTLRVIGRVGSRRDLHAAGRRSSPILAALDYPDRRVQFAAATAVMQLNPDSRFPGSQRVVNVLARALNDSGSAKCLVVDANSQRGSTMAGFLSELGYDPQLAITGREGFRAAVEQMDVELIALHMNTLRWALSQTVANLRADARSAQIPIVVYGPDSMRHRVDGLIARNSLMTFIAEADTADRVHSQISPFLERLRTPALTPQQRAEQMVSAASWLAHIADGQRTRIFRIESAEAALIRAINEPELAADVLRVLGAVPTGSAQQQLQEYAVSERIGPKLRQMAAIKLAQHIQRFGLLLSVRQVFEVETSWRSASDPDVATALASVVGTLKPDNERVGQRLRTYQQPAP